MRKSRAGQVFLWIFLLGGTAVFIFPFLFMISNSFEDFTYMLPDPPRLLPEKFVLSNYMSILQNQHIDIYFINSVIITLATTVIGIVISTLSAFVDEAVRKVIIATPDRNNGSAGELEFTYSEHASGILLEFTVPNLEIWDLVCIETEPIQ